MGPSPAMTSVLTRGRFGQRHTAVRQYEREDHRETVWSPSAGKLWMPEEARRGSSLWVSWNEPDPTSIFKDLFIFILCVWVLCLHVLLRYHVGARYPQRPAEE